MLLSLQSWYSVRKIGFTIWNLKFPHTVKDCTSVHLYDGRNFRHLTTLPWLLIKRKRESLSSYLYFIPWVRTRNELSRHQPSFCSAVSILCEIICLRGVPSNDWSINRSIRPFHAKQKSIWQRCSNTIMIAISKQSKTSKKQRKPVTSHNNIQVMRRRTGGL